MRLTLRTLLAYLDDTLEPAAAKEIGQKLSETAAAQELVTRIREVTRQRRLTAPPLEGDRVDPDTMAQYLDNLLGPDEVAAFEKGCLGSDMHLAETAACHQILTLIGQPAHVTESMRQRMYKLLEPGSEKADDRHRAPQAEPAGRSWLGRLPGARVIAAAIVTIVILAIVVALVLKSLPPTGQSVPGQEVARETGQANPGRYLPKVPPEEQEPQAPEFPPETQPEPPTSDDRPESPPVEAAATAQPKAGGEAAPPKTEPAASPVAPEPGDREPIQKKSAQPEPAASKTPEPEVSEPATLGQYVSRSGMLMRSDGSSDGEWRRIAPSTAEQFTPIRAKDPLLCLPSHRAAVQLTGGHTIELVGETELRLLVPGDKVDVHLELDRGRLVLGTNNRAARFRIDFLKQSWVITLQGPETTLGLELHAPWMPGTESEHHVYLCLSDGEAELQSDEQLDRLGAPVELRWTSADGFAERQTLAVPPAWIEREEMSVLMARASARLEEYIRVGESPVLRFIEAAGDAHRESSWREVNLLAIQCLGAIGKLQPVIDMLRAVDRRDLRRESIQVLRQFMERGALQEALLRQALVDQLRSEDGAEAILGLLRGFSDDEFKQDKTYESLITLLDFPDLAVRELAIDNLQELTGRDLRYSPERPTTRVMQAWRHLLDEGRLPPKVRGRM